MWTRLSCGLVLLLVARGAFAQTTYTWNGVSGSNWENGSNWLPNGIPGSTLGDAVVISGGGSVILSSRPTNALSSLFVQSGTLTLHGAAWNLDVTQGNGLLLVGDAANAGTVVLDDDNSAGGGIALSAKAVTIAAGSAISADGCGAAAGSPSGGNGAGPGGGACSSGSSLGCAGGGYGGMGAAFFPNFPPGSSYGSIFAPTDVGSGGGSNSNSAGQGTAGGGRIRLVVSGSLLLSGTISANALPSSGDTDGAGSGGSVWISAGAMSGAGTVWANGGNSFGAGGGGGGRIALDGYSGGVGYFITAGGGLGLGNSPDYGGAAGTVAFTPAGGGTTVRVDNRVNPTTIASTPLGGLVAQDLYLSGSATVIMSDNEEVTLSGLLSLLPGSTILVGGFDGTRGGVFQAHAATIQIQANLTADGAGYSGGSFGAGLGPGGGGGSGLGGYPGGGAGHGGDGGAKPAEAVAGAMYASGSAPVDLGSGGGGGSISGMTYGGTGGGSIRLFATNTLSVGANISVLGRGGSGAGAGGGAGGSIFLAAPTITGTGALVAAGGSGDVSWVTKEGGGGGGGRIAVFSQSPAAGLGISIAGGASTYPGTSGTAVQPPGNSFIPLAPPVSVGGGNSFSWSGPAIPAGGTYVLYVDDDNHLGPGEPSANHPETGEAQRIVNTTSTSAAVIGLTAGTTYFWHVELHDSGGVVVAGSGIQTFVACTTACYVPPQFTSTANSYGECGVPYQYSSAGVPTLSGTTPLVFSVGVVAGEAAPAGLTVSSSTGAFNWAPTNQDEGLHHIRLTATGPGGSATQSYDLVVTCSNARQTHIGCACNLPGGAIWGPGWLLLSLWTLRSRARRF